MLVTYDEQAQFLDIPSGTDKQLIEDLLAGTIALFEKECGREAAPFASAITGRTEIVEVSPGSRRIWLDYPINTITSIGVGLDVNAPDETLSPALASLVVWRVGERWILRTDGGVWGHWSPRWVKVVYNTLDERPADVQLAIKRVVATIYQHRGKEGFTSMTRGSRSWTMAEQAATDDEFWQAAVRNHGTGVVA